MPRSYKCLLTDCQFTNDGLTRGFFAFPCEPVLLEKWLKNLNLDEKPKDDCRICFKHFSEDELQIGNTRVDLKKGG